jgi:hypothetical protein
MVLGGQLERQHGEDRQHAQLEDMEHGVLVNGLPPKVGGVIDEAEAGERPDSWIVEV